MELKKILIITSSVDETVSYIMKKYSEIVFQACRETKVTLATLGNDAGMYGAAKLVIEE